MVILLETWCGVTVNIRAEQREGSTDDNGIWGVAETASMLQRLL